MRTFIYNILSKRKCQLYQTRQSQDYLKNTKMSPNCLKDLIFLSRKPMMLFMTLGFLILWRRFTYNQ